MEALVVTNYFIFYWANSAKKVKEFKEKVKKYDFSLKPGTIESTIWYQRPKIAVFLKVFSIN